MSDVEITCTPRHGILAVSADTVAALDHLAATLPAGASWQVDVLVGRTPTDTIRLTARPHTDPTLQEDAA